MRRDSVLRSTSLRLALGFSLLFLAAFLVTGLAVYQLIRLELERRQDQTVSETYAVIAASYGEQDLNDLLDAVATNVLATRGAERVFLVLAPGGQVLGGNLPSFVAPNGWSSVDGAALGLEPDLHYRIYTGSIDGNTLVVGASGQEIDELEEIVLAGFAWGAMIIACFAIVGGSVTAMRVQRRFDAVRDTMERVSHGELSARIPLLGKHDDIDALCGDINDALARLATTVEAMRQVSADIAHELKTPLNRLKLTIEEALERKGPGKEARSALLAASAEADQISRTFDALLRIAQIEAGARKARFAAVDLRELLFSLVEIYDDVAADAHQMLRFDGNGAIRTVAGDRELLTQMFANLIENAIRHCPEKTLIRVGLRISGGEITAYVADNGIGIPEEERAKVFRRMYRLEKSRTSPGSGLGLSLAKAVAELHDAKMRMQDAAPGLRIEVRFAEIPPDSRLSPRE